MAAQYLKSVRTRFRNILTNENEKATYLINDIRTSQTEGLEIDKESYADRMKRCMEKIQQYREKLEIQSEKLATAMTERNRDACKEIIDDDSDRCEQSMERYLDLKSLKAKLLKVVKSEPSSEALFTDHFVKMQKQMQTFMRDQVKQQRGFIDRQEKKDATLPSVILPKIEFLSFNGNKLM